VNELELFRAAAREDMSDEDIEWWLRLARPCLHLVRGGDGPVVGHFGGRPALPASVAWPARTVHLASIDLAAIPRDTLDLGLPADGTLVFFSKTHIVPDGGHVIHVPAGTAVTEAEPPEGTPSVYDRFPLQATPDWSLPECADDSPLYVGERREDETIFEEIVWCLESEQRGRDTVVVLGGYGTSNTGGVGVPLDSEAGQVLLAEFYLTEKEVGKDFETDFSTLFYMMTRDDLAARRFDGLVFASDFHG
jgi:hypothetical protein